MKLYLVLGFTVLLASAQSQTFSDQFFKDFADPAGDEVYMNKCDFDPDASAIYLRKDATILADGPKMFKYCRNRIKILKPTGLDEGNIKIRYYRYGDYEKISNIKAVSINYDKDGTKKMMLVEPKDIHYVKEDQYYGSISFAMPEVKEGTIVEYSYISERATYQLVDYWYFQDDLPVLHSTFDYTIMPGAQFAYRVLKPTIYPVQLKEYKTEGRLVFEMHKLPGINDEPFMDSKRDYLSRVELQMNSAGYGIDREKFVGSWPELTENLLKDEDFGQMLNKKISGTEDLVTIAKLLPSTKDRMNFLFLSVQKKLTWNHYIGIYAREKLKTVWEKSTGSAPEINLLLLNLLYQAGVEAYPLLVSDRYHGKVNNSHPFINQFSKVIAYVQIDGKQYFLDATENHSNTDLIPKNFLNTQGYLVDRKKSRFIDITDPVHFEKRTVNISGKITNDGQLKGQAFITDRDYSRIKTEAELRRDRQNYISTNFIKPYEHMQVDSFEARNIDTDTLALEQLLEFKYALDVSGEYYMLNPHIFGTLDENPFIAENRYTEINFGYKRSVNFQESFELADGVALESLPKTIGMRTQDTGLVINRITDVSPDGKHIVMKIKLDINRSLYPADEYSAVREFFKKMFDILNEPVVFKKKS